MKDVPSQLNSRRRARPKENLESKIFGPIPGTSKYPPDKIVLRHHQKGRARGQARRARSAVSLRDQAGRVKKARPRDSTLAFRKGSSAKPMHEFDTAFKALEIGLTSKSWRQRKDAIPNRPDSLSNARQGSRRHGLVARSTNASQSRSKKTVNFPSDTYIVKLGAVIGVTSTSKTPSTAASDG